MFTARNVLHEVELEQQRLHARYIQPGGVVRVVIFAMRALSDALLALLHKLGVVQIAPPPGPTTAAPLKYQITNIPTSAPYYSKTIAAHAVLTLATALKSVN